jgi:putative FmdB family regulatory protein
MPTYEFFCEKCKKSYELAMRIADIEKRKTFRCPECKSTRFRRQISSFQTITSKKS